MPADGLAGGYYSLIERVGTMDMAYQGTATGVASEKRIATTFSGRVLLKAAMGGAMIAQCTAPDHRLEFARSVRRVEKTGATAARARAPRAASRRRRIP